MLLSFAACVPETTPPVQLEHTPGPGVVINGDVYDSGQFRAQIPAGWRVITSAASDPVTVIFAAPDAPALIMLGEVLDSAPPPAGYDGELRTERRDIELDNGLLVNAILHTTPEDWDSSIIVFDAVIESISLSF